MADLRLDGFAALRIGLGSALGGLTRVLVGAQFAVLPMLGTALVNISGALFIGLLHVVTLPEGRWPMPAGLRQALLAGVLGGFTTFSILSMETLALLQAGELPAATLNLFGSLGLALLAVAAGHTLGARLNG